MWTTEDVTEEAVRELMAVRESFGSGYLCVCDREIHGTRVREHAAECAELRAFVRDRLRYAESPR
jgi:hypothetical protein